MALWVGNLVTGLLSVPVGLEKGTRETESFHTHCKAHHAPIQRPMVCSVGGETLTPDDVIKVAPDGRIVEARELEACKLPSDKTIEVVRCGRKRDLDLRYVIEPYYLVPRTGGERGYAAFRRALALADAVAIARVVVHGRMWLLALDAVGDLIVAYRLRFQESLLAPPQVPAPAKKPARGDVAGLVQVGRLRLDEFADPYRSAVAALGRRRVTGRQLKKELAQKAKVRA